METKQVTFRPWMPAPALTRARGFRRMNQAKRAVSELRTFVFSHVPSGPQGVIFAHLSAIEQGIDELTNAGSVLARLARVEDDLAAFRRAHAEHTHRMSDGKVDVPKALDSASAAMAQVLHDTSIADLRANAEDRAWQVIEEFAAVNPTPGTCVLIRLPEIPGDQWDVKLLEALIIKQAREPIAVKRGTSRLDALAHLASWCQAEMPEQP